jgi:hypothetical protein
MILMKLNKSVDVSRKGGRLVDACSEAPTTLICVVAKQHMEQRFRDNRRINTDENTYKYEK